MFLSWRSFLHHLYINRHAGGEIEVREGLDNFGRWVQDVDEAFVDNFAFSASLYIMHMLLGTVTLCGGSFVFCKR